MRLAGGGVAEDGRGQYGRLEVFVGGGWGAVCESAPRAAGDERRLLDERSRFNGTVRFNAAAAGVMCRQLGFAAGFSPQPTVRLCAGSRVSMHASDGAGHRCVAVSWQVPGDCHSILRAEMEVVVGVRRWRHCFGPLLLAPWQQS